MLPDEVIRVFQRARELGVTFMDTAQHDRRPAQEPRRCEPGPCGCEFVGIVAL